MKQEIIKALVALRKQEEGKKRKFNQGVDLIINLKNFNLKKENINLFVPVLHKIKDKRIMAFLTEKNEKVNTVTKKDFLKYKDKKEIKKLMQDYDFFISSASLMPQVATTFGRFLGPAGKMPSPQLGVLIKENDEEIEKLIGKIDKTVRVRSKEASLKLLIGKEEMENEKISENVEAVYNAVLNTLPRKKEQIKNVLIKFTMGKPEKVKW